MALSSNAELSEDQFRALSKIAYDEAGLHLPDSKKAFVYSRLQKRLRVLRLKQFSEYSSLLAGIGDAAQRERLEMISALTTNVTQFFRESHHFDTLKSEILPVLERRAQAGHPVRIWSAGCSNGQEPYSIALYCQKYAPRLMAADFRILASDIDPTVLGIGQAACYPNDALPPEARAEFDTMIRPAGHTPGQFTFTQDILNKIKFRKLNLLKEWPFSGRFDVIFCRNVAIYFDAPTQKTLFDRFGGQLQPHGWLFLGHSERAGTEKGAVFRSDGLTTYRLQSHPTA